MRKRRLLIIVGLVALVSLGASWKVRSYLEDTVHVSGHVGQMMLAVRDDAVAAKGADGDYVPLQVDASGNLYTTSIPGTGASNIGKAESGTHTTADVGVMMLSVRDDTAPTSTAANGQYAALLTNATGNLYVADEVAAGILGTIDTDTGNIAADTGTMNTSLNNIESEVIGTTHFGKTLLTAKIDVDLTGGADSAAIIAADGSKIIYIVELHIEVDAQCQLQYTDGAEAASTSGIEHPRPAYGGVHLERDSGYRFALDASEGMFLDDIDGGTVEVRGYVWYYQE